MLLQTHILLLSLSPALTSAGVLPAWLVAERDSDICGVQGRADMDNNYFSSSSKKLTSYSGCSARCASQSRCESFGYNDNTCMLFDESLSGNFRKDSHSGVTFYDVGCVDDEDDDDESDTTLSTTAARTTSSHVQSSTVRATATRTKTVPISTTTSSRGSNSTAVVSTLNLTTKAVGSLVTLRPTSAADATTIVVDPTPTPSVAGDSGSSSSTNVPSVYNGTLVSPNATSLGAPLYRNTTTISFSNSPN